MSDDRTKRQKLEAMAAQSASPAEAEVARELLRRLDGPVKAGQSGRLLSRDAILASPDRDSAGGTVRYRASDGTVFIVDVEEMTFVRDVL